MQVLILADGAFPTSEKCLTLLRDADHIVCCDGAVVKLLNFGREPEAIVGDLDSLPAECMERFADRLHKTEEQETNDLTKAVQYCLGQGFDDIIILGATGLREDHTLGNISLLADYALQCHSVCLLTDYGRIDSFRSGGEYVIDENHLPGGAPEICTTRDGRYTVARFDSSKGQQVSIFALTPETHISSLGLAYRLEDRCLTSWWQGTLNESNGDQFSLSIDQGCLLVYRLDQ